MDTEKRNDRRFMREKRIKIPPKSPDLKRSLLMNLREGTYKRTWKSKLGGVHRQKNQPGTSTKLGRRISKCGSETRSTNARFKGQDPRRGLHVLKNINRKKVNMVGMKTFRGKTCGRFAVKDHRCEAKLGKVLEVCQSPRFRGSN